MSKYRKVMFISLLCLFFLTGTAVGNSLWGNYEGFSKVKLLLDGAEVTPDKDRAPAFLINNNVVVPARQLANLFGVPLEFDSSKQTLKMYKPNVHLFFARNVDDKLNPSDLFSKVKKDLKHDFVLFAQVDNLKIQSPSIKITIEDPSGTVVAEVEENNSTPERDNFWFVHPFQVTFSQKGTYTAKFAIRVNGTYQVVSEKTITSE